MKRAAAGRRLPKLLAVAALMGSAVCIAQSPTFSVQVLHDFSGGAGSSVNGINNAGDAVGGAGGGSSVCPNYCAVIWHDGSPTALGAVEGASETVALSINNAGQIAGLAITGLPPAYPTDQAVIWNNGTPTLLPSPGPQYTQTYTAGVNDTGQVAGSATGLNDGNEVSVPVEWNGSTALVLSPVSGFTGPAYAAGINDNGLVVGTDDSGEFIGYPEPVAWQGTTATLLPKLEPPQGASGGKALAVNDLGLVVGAIGNAAAFYGQAVAWANGVATALGVLRNGGFSAATAVNNRGVIVGEASTIGYDENHAVLWSRIGATIQDLNDLISASASGQFALTGASGINDSCAIVANGYYRRTNASVALLLTPTDPSFCTHGS
jgi:uncharacterized membrane protein